MENNNKLLPGLGGKSLSPSQIRRNGFKEAVPDLHKLANGYAGLAGLSTADVSPAAEAEARAIMDADTWPGHVTELMCAILATRIFTTRAAMELEARRALTLGTFRKFDTSHVEKFAEGAKERLAATNMRLMRGFGLTGGERSASAVAYVFDRAAFVAFSALEAEANGVLDTATPFDEASFWEDFFRGVADADPTGYVVKGFAAVYLDHVEEFRTATVEDMAVDNRRRLRAV